MSLEVFWYLVIMASIISYAMLDGFDLGVGCLHLCTKEDAERRVFLNAIGPVWDGNEVWLVVVTGALLAGFPEAYATFFSAYYLPITGLIAALIFRACAIEFRSKHRSKVWRAIWDISFCASSLLIAFAVGVTIGNLAYGFPLNESHDFVGSKFASFLHPYTVLIGILVVALFMMHGSIFLIMKTENALQEKLSRWVTPTVIFFIMSYVTATMATLIYLPHMTDRLREMPYLFVLVLINMFVIANIPRTIHKKQMGVAFIFSCLNICLLMALFAIGTFPNLVLSNIHPENGLTIYNSAASQGTLFILMIIVLIGIPLVFAYGYYIYRVFRGKVHVDDHMSY